MKKLLLFIFFLISGLFSFGQKLDLIWDYPKKPGTDEWLTLKSSREILEACQIPEEILHKLSTQELAYLCINNPILGEMLLASNLQEGFEGLSKTINGFQELKLREDAGSELLEFYLKFDLDSFRIKRTKRETTNLFLDMCFDIVMAQPVFLEKLTPQQEKILIKEAFNKLVNRQQAGETFYHQKTTIVILSRLLYKYNISLKEADQYGNDKYLLLNNYYILEDEQIIENIKHLAEKYLEING
jgi:hypothetical protein